MIGTISDIENNKIYIDLKIDLSKTKNIIHSFLLIKEEEKQFIAEIEKIKNNICIANLIGIFENNKVIYGVILKPSFNAQVYLIQRDFIPTILGQYKNDLILGLNPLYNENITVNLNSFFSSHFAIFGSTGSGKSCAFARIMQNLFNDNMPKNSKFIIFDAYGEYHQAFANIKENNFKAITTDTNSTDELLKIPLWLLNTDDLSLLLNVNKSFQTIILDKTLRFVNVFSQKSQESTNYKNSIIANALLEIIMSGRNPVQIRDQVISLLSKYNTLELNLESKIEQPGYIRTFRQCMLIDAEGKINAIELVEKFLQNYVMENMNLNLPDGSYKYTLKDVLDSLEFALIDEGVWKSEEIYNSTNSLKVRLQNLIKSDYSKYFDMEYLGKEEFIKSIFKATNNTQAQIINFNINYIDDRFAKVVTKIYSKLFFDYAKNLKVRASMSFNIILEEAHRYVQNDDDINIIGYNIFERICKEGRKYGVIMGFISQRPSELSESCLSQCSNFLLFKMIHVIDLNYVRETIPFITDEIITQIKCLIPGSCMAFGKSFNFPMIIKFLMPNPSPSSDNVDICKLWY